MDSLKHSLVQMVLNETVTKLVIVNRGKASREHKISKKPPKEIRFGTKVHDELKRELDPFKQTLEVMTQYKQEQEMNNIIAILMETLEKYAHKKDSPFESLKLFVSNILKEEAEEKSIIEECNENKRILVEEKAALNKLIKDGEQELKEADKKLAQIRCQLKYIKQVNKLEHTLVCEWENSRLSQAELVAEKAEKELAKYKDIYKKKFEVEDLVIKNVEKFNAIQLEELEGLIDEWEEKYNREFYHMYKKNKVLQDELDEMQRVFEKKKQIYNEHKAFNESYLAMVAERERQMAILQHRIDCTIKIQAWWRGVMVRKGFGQFRKKSKKGKKGKKK